MAFEETIRSMLISKDFFSGDEPVMIARAPGRLDLMGGNDDYTGGLVFESTIREATYAAAQLRGDRSVQLKNKTVSDAGWKGAINISLDELKDEHKVKEFVNQSSDIRWTAYVLGNIHFLLKKFPHKINVGVSIYMESTVPLNRGVSSSAAIEVAVMKSCAAVYGIDLKGIELALACQWVENVICDSACGIMDQIAVVSGKAGYVLPLVCQPCIPEELIQLPGPLAVWGIDSGVSHQVAGIEYEAARAAAFMGYKIICDLEHIPVTREQLGDIPRYTDPVWNGYLANLSYAVFHGSYEHQLPLTMSRAQYLQDHEEHVDPFTPLKDGVPYHVRANTRYAVQENQRVQLFSELSRGASLAPSERSFILMGELMYQSHYSYTECGLGAQATDFLVELFRKHGAKEGVYGAKITGGGAGGTVAILAKAEAGPLVKSIFEEYVKAGLGKPYLFEGSSDGADRFGIKKITQTN